jgi:nitroreductase
LSQVALMDAAHLAQTFYPVCAELGLGAFVTAAVNGANIEKRLGLDLFTEGPWRCVAAEGLPLAGSSTRSSSRMCRVKP